MTINVAWSDRYLRWRLGLDHPTNPVRALNAIRLLESDSLGFSRDTVKVVTWSADSSFYRYYLSRVHDPGYVAEVLDHGISREWVGRRPDLGEVALEMFAGTVTLRNLHVGAGQSGLGDVYFAPMGAKHHAMRDRSSGFCVFNDFAWLADDLASRGETVGYLDWDAHHGDGVEALVGGRVGVVTASIHDSTIFPGTGHDRNPRPGIYNWPLEEHAGDDALEQAVAEALELFTESGVSVVLLAAGADGLESDPLSSLTYTHRGIARVSQMVGDWVAANRTPIFIGGAGGYRPHDDTPIAWAITVATIWHALSGLRAATASRT